MSKNEGYCPYCGSATESGSQFCQNCGAALSDVEKTPTVQIIQTPPPASTGYYQQSATQQGPYHQQTTTVYVPQKKDDNLGALSLIFAVLSIVVFPIFSIPAIILGHISLSKSKNSPAIAGLVIGYLVFAVIIGVIIWLGFVFWWY